ncbi:MAG: EamA family transporter [Vicinamibacteria bacterium]
MPSLPSWLFWALLSAAFAALTAIFGKVGVEGVNPDYATLIRTIVILVFISGMVMASGSSQPFSAISGKSYAFLVLSGLATGASWLCYYRALQLGPASKVAPVDKLSVVLVAIFAFTFLGERLTVRNWLGIVLIAAGALLASMKR